MSLPLLRPCVLPRTGQPGKEDEEEEEGEETEEEGPGMIVPGRRQEWWQWNVDSCGLGGWVCGVWAGWTV